MEKRQSRSQPSKRKGKQYSQNSNVINIDNRLSPQAPPKRAPNIVPRNESQRYLLAAIADRSKPIVFATGPAGTGKTMLATHSAILALKAGDIEKIVITRPNVAVDDADIGFLPGNVIEKMTPWMMPILDVFYEHYSKQDVLNMLEDGTIEMIALSYVRGRTFKKAIVILDEAQNTTPSSMLSVLTRIGEGSKMVVTGDVKQSDRSKDRNGLIDFIRRFDEHNPSMVELVEFEQKDVQRHPVIKQILEMYKDID